MYNDHVTAYTAYTPVHKLAEENLDANTEINLVFIWGIETYKVYLDTYHALSEDFHLSVLYPALLYLTGGGSRASPRNLPQTASPTNSKQTAKPLP